jgi:hypothetical protein
LGEQQEKQPRCAYGAEEHETKRISASRHLFVAADPQEPAQKRFGRAEDGVKEGGRPIEHPGQVESYRSSQPYDERQKSEVFQLLSNNEA